MNALEIFTDLCNTHVCYKYVNIAQHVVVLDKNKDHISKIKVN